MGEAIYADKNFVEVRQVEKFDALDLVPTEVQIEYRITTPFEVVKGPTPDDPDVVIRGPVYVGSDEMLDRHGELVDADAILAAWDKYSKNPVILYNHSKTYGVIGKMVNVMMGDWEELGNVPLGTAHIDAGEKDIARKINKGMLKAFSIGFIAKAAIKVCEDEDDCYIRFTEIDWVETSVVDVPASPGALFSVQKTMTLARGEKENAKTCDCAGPCCDDKSAIGGNTPTHEDHIESESQKLDLFTKPIPFCLAKEEVGTDLFTTPDEAADRGDELGCGGYHTVEDADGNELFMPCESHDEYEGSLGDEIIDEHSEVDLVKNLVATTGGITEQGIMTDAEIEMTEEVTDEPITAIVEAEVPELPTDEKISTGGEALVDALESEATEEPVEDEKVELQAEDTTEQNDTPTGVEVLMEVVSVLKDFEARMGSIEAVIDQNDSLSETIEQLSAAITERDELIESLTNEKEAVVADAKIEAEVAKRVAAHLTTAGIEVTPTAAERKTTTTTDDDAHRVSDVTRFDPQPEVSKGMNGLASWLEANIAGRGSGN